MLNKHHLYYYTLKIIKLVFYFIALFYHIKKYKEANKKFIILFLNCFIFKYP